MTGRMPSPDDTALRRTLGDIGGSWHWALLFAVCTLVSGVLLLVWPDGTLHVLAVLVGLQFLAMGVFRFVRAFAGHGGDSDHGTTAEVLIAVLALLAGVLCLRNPLQTMAAVSVIVGVLWLVTGVLMIHMALSGHELVPRRTAAVAYGALSAVAGIIVLTFPVESAVALTRLLGLWLVLLGLVELVGALTLRSAGRGKRPHGVTAA